MAPMPERSPIETVRENIRAHERALAMLETRLAELRRRRRGASDGVMVTIDESIATTQKAMVAMGRILTINQEVLERALARSHPPGANATRSSAR